MCFCVCEIERVCVRESVCVCVCAVGVLLAPPDGFGSADRTGCVTPS